MKRRLSVCGLMLICVTMTVAAYDKRLVYVLEQLRQCRTAFGEAPMIAGAAPNEFFLLFPYVSQIASNSDLNAMSHDKNAVVRIMAAKCAINRTKMPEAGKVLDQLLSDSTVVVVFRGTSDAGSSMTVSEIVKHLREDPDFPGPIKPNHAPDPTALAVTPAADAPVAPAGGRGSS